MPTNSKKPAAKKAPVPAKKVEVKKPIVVAKPVVKTAIKSTPVKAPVVAKNNLRLPLRNLSLKQPLSQNRLLNP